jgi:hypothetical protein
VAPVTKSVEVVGGDAITVTIDVTSAPTPPPAGPTPTPTPTQPTPSVEPAGMSPLVYVGFGAGVAGLAVGSVFGILALGTKSDLDGVCSGKTCPTFEQSTGDRLTLQATVSTIGFGVGVVGAIVGTYFLVAGGGKTGRAVVAPWLDARTAGVAGRF